MKKDPIIAMAELSGATRCRKWYELAKPKNAHYTPSLEKWLNDVRCHIKRTKPQNYHS